MGDIVKTVIVIGSGISGMTCACALANKGYNVHVFEKHHKCGGYCQAFSRNGFRFSAAVHRVGGIYGKTNVDNILDELGMKDRLEWYRFKDYIRVGDIRIDMCNTDISSRLKELFPDDAGDIDHFNREIEVIDNILNIIDNGSNQGIEKFTPDTLKTLSKYRRMTSNEFLDLSFKNKAIKSILTAIADALPGGSVFSFIRMVSFANVGHYTYNPVGGANSIINVLRRRIEELNGEIHLNSPVEKIIIKAGAAVGIISKGTEYDCDYIVSNCDFHYTVNQLIGAAHVDQRLLYKMEHDWVVNPSCFCVWIGLDSTLTELGYEPVNLTYYPDKENVIEDKLKIISEGSVQRDSDFLLISTSANEDKTCCPDGKSQIMLGMLVNNDFEQHCDWKGSGSEEAYKNRKQEIAEKLIEKAGQFFPKLREHIEFTEIATPWTFERYTGNRKGAFGGYKCTPKLVEDYAKIDGHQIVPHVFLSGHWGGVGDGVIFTTDVALRIADKILRCDKRTDLYDFNRKHQMITLSD